MSEPETFWEKWKPTGFTEVFTFAIIMSVFAFIIFLFHYNSIQKEVRAGRCYKLQDANAMLGSYTINAKNSRNEDLYKVDYNLDSRRQIKLCL